MLTKLINTEDDSGITAIKEPVSPIRKSTSFYFIDNCESSAWICDHCLEEIAGTTSPDALGYNYCPFCGLPIERCEV